MSKESAGRRGPVIYELRERYSLETNTCYLINTTDDIDVVMNLNKTAYVR